jgi:hypothetical protein
MFCIQLTNYIRLALIPLAVVVAIAYEHYHLMACNYRASILRAVRIRKDKESATLSLEDGRSASPLSLPTLTSPNLKDEHGVAFRKWYQLTDWAGLPFVLVLYYVIPTAHAMIKQLWTNRLEYKVSLKPTVNATSGAEENLVELHAVASDKSIDIPTPSVATGVTVMTTNA